MGKAKQKWRKKAWLVNPNKTKIILVATASRKPKHVPPWIHKELDPSVKDLFAMSNIRKEYFHSLSCPSTNEAETSNGTKEREDLPF
jgi:hypothetical protein